LHSRHLREQLSRQLIRARGGGVTELARIAFAVVDQLVQRLDWQRGSHCNEVGPLADERDWREIGHRVERNRAMEARIDGHPVLRHQQRMAVGLGPGYSRESYVAVSPGAILDHDVLPDLVLQLAGEGPSDRVRG